MLDTLLSARGQQDGQSEMRCTRTGLCGLVSGRSSDHVIGTDCYWLATTSLFCQSFRQIHSDAATLLVVGEGAETVEEIGVVAA